MIQLEQHYGWTMVPFQRTAEKEQFYGSQMHQEALARLQRVVNQREFGLGAGSRRSYDVKMRMKKYQAISQRIALSYHLHGLSESETVAYIRHHMKQTGSAQPMFTDGAMHKIFTASQGIPRVINHLCIQALYDAVHRASEVVEESHIGRILLDQERQRGTAC